MMWIPFLYILCYKIKKQLQKLMSRYGEDSMVGKAADYTLFVGGLPTDVTEEELRAELIKIGKPEGVVPIEISCVYDLSRVYALFESKKKLEEELEVSNYHNLQKWRFNPFMLMVKKKPFVRSTRYLERNLANVMSLLNLYEEKEFSKYKRTRQGFITFSTIREKHKFAKLLKKVPGYHIHANTPEPDQVSWKNISFPRYKRYIYLLISFACQLLLVAVCAAINVALTILQVGVLPEQDEN